MTLQNLGLIHRFFLDPYDVQNNTIDLVRQVSEWSVSHLYAGLHASSLTSSVELEALTRQPVPVHRLQQMPEGTLGREFLGWYTQSGMDLAHLTTAYTLSQQGAWPIARFGKLHDLQHLVTGIPATRLGEIELQGMVLGTGHPDFFAALNVLLLPLLAYKSGDFVAGVAAFLRGVERGRGCEDLLLFPYENYWEFTLEEVRDLLGISR